MDLEKMSHISVYDELVNKQGLILTQSILEICSFEISDNGTYECIADNGVSNDSITFTVSVLPDDSMLNSCKQLEFPLSLFL